jgi:exonuclease SbcC
MSKIRTRGLIILDEPTDGFSEAQINKIRDILQELDAEQLIIVSHEQKIESFVDNVIKVTKEADTSSIEEILTQKQN